MSELILSRLTSLEEAMKCQKCGAVEEWETCTGEGENVLWNISSGIPREPTPGWDGWWRCMNCNNIQKQISLT